MKIAYLIQCHLDPQHNARLVNKLTNDTSNHAFIHVDLKVDIKPFIDALNDCDSVTFLKDRMIVHWGGYSSVKATLALMESALKYGNFDRFVFLQGLEYPIKSNKEIDAFFSDHSETEFILAKNISSSNEIAECHKHRLYYSFDNIDKFYYKILHMMNIFAMRHGFCPKFKPDYVMDHNENRLQIYNGCAQFGLTKAAVQYIVSYSKNNPKFNTFFKSMYAPDESYFHTIIYNSKYIEKTPYKKAICRPHMSDYENLTYFEYPVYVTLFTDIADWPRIQNSGLLYFRKASSESKLLLDYIDDIHKKMEKANEHL